MTVLEPTFHPRWARSVADLEPRPATGGGRAPISFAYGLPDPALFPTESLNAAADLVLRRHSDHALQYGAGQGLPQLISVLIERLNRAEGLALRPEECMITTGAGQAIAVVARALLDPGDTVLVETPAWPGALNAFRRCNARLVAVPVDAEGLDTVALEQTLETLAAAGTRPKLLYTVPNFQNPTGVTTTLARRQALLDLAQRYDLLILEDDAYRDLAFEGALPPSLFALDTDGRVLRTGTYSKILAAGLRLGWLLGPREVLPRLIALKDDGGTSPFTAYLAAAYSLAGELEPHIARLVDSYRRKRDVMLGALTRYFPKSVTWTVPAGGFFVWVTLPPGTDAADLLRAAREEGVDFLPGRSCFPDPADGTSHLRLAFSLPTPDQIEEGIKRLGGVLDAALG